MPRSDAVGPEAAAGRHLDLGCGSKPRNPYRRAEIVGVDVAGEAAGIDIRRANVTIEPIPFPDGSFNSVSAYDFLEHVPRVLPTADGRGTRFPFVELMNEIWRVLVPGGLFYGQTPGFPHAMAFQEPTHVNIVTDKSHIYFTRPELRARPYGFRGEFEIVRVLRVRPEFEYEPVEPGWYRRWLRRRRQRRGKASHLIWEFRKPGGGDGPEPLTSDLRL